MLVFLFFNDTATTEIYTLSLHDALPISSSMFFTSGRPTRSSRTFRRPRVSVSATTPTSAAPSRNREQSTSTTTASRSEEHTSELQSRQYLVCRLLLEKHKKYINTPYFQL